MNWQECTSVGAFTGFSLFVGGGLRKLVNSKKDQGIYYAISSVRKGNQKEGKKKT